MYEEWRRDPCSRLPLNTAVLKLHHPLELHGAVLGLFLPRIDCIQLLACPEFPMQAS